MAAQYSHKHFFRKAPNQLLAQYFQAKGIDLGIDFAALKETQVDPIFDAFRTLSEALQAEIEPDFLDINALACESGVAALIDEADYHGEEGFAEQIAAIEGFHGKAMWAFLERPQYWQGASMFLHADNISPSYWKKRNDFPCVPPHVDETSLEELAKAISTYFFEAEGRGRNCKVEPYQRHHKEYFFAYPEDFGQSDVEWEQDALKMRARHPAFEIIFVYCEAEGSLDIYAPRNTKAVPELQAIFARTVLKLETLPDGSIDERVYNLAAFDFPDFEFVIEPGSPIVRAVVTRMRVALMLGDKRRISVEADTGKDAQAVIKLLRGLALPPYFINQVTVRAYLAPSGGAKKGTTRTFNITYPNSCALNHDGTDLLLRRMLIQSGIEPQKPKP